jgi:hypothetical protein
MRLIPAVVLTASVATTVLCGCAVGLDGARAAARAVGGGSGSDPRPGVRLGRRVLGVAVELDLGAGILGCAAQGSRGVGPGKVVPARPRVEVHTGAVAVRTPGSGPLAVSRRVWALYSGQGASTGRDHG